MQIETYKEGVKLYNSQNTSNKMLRDNFVIRLHEYNKLWKAISTVSMRHPEQHYIVQGVRGAGKTTLLSRLALEIEDDKSLSNWLIPIVFKEEEYGITSLFTLWERVCEELDENHQSDFSGLLDHVESLPEMDPKQALNILDACLVKANKKIILFIDNIVELFDHFNPKEQDTLREVLITNNNIRLIGGSAISLESFHDYKAPFYQFFNVITLKGLKQKDTIALLKKLSEHNGQEEQEKLNSLLLHAPEKIESIRRLTGGIPRTLVILFNILMDGPKGKTFNLLEETIDQTTPLYKHRMDDLSSQQKPIVNAIALNWDAMSAKEIADKTRLTSKQVSAQLGQLEKQWIIEKIPTNTKNNLYALKERFFNIWYLMRYGRRQDRKKVIWLTRFFEIWCSGDELKDRATSFMQQLNKDSNPHAILTFANALICSKSLKVNDKKVLTDTVAHFFEQSGNDKFNRELLSVEEIFEVTADEIDRLFSCWVGKLGDADPELTEKLSMLLKAKKDQVRLSFVQLYAKNKQVSLQAELQLKKISSEEATAALAGFYFDHARFDDAILMVKQSKDLDEPFLLKLLAHCYQGKENYPEAEKNYMKALELGAEGCNHPLATIYVMMEQYEKAEKQARLAIEAGDKQAYIELGVSLCELKKFNEALDAFKHALKINIDYSQSGIHFFIGGVYFYLQQYIEAENNLLQAIKLAPEYSYASSLLAEVYLKQDKLIEAKKTLNELTEQGHSESFVTLANLAIKLQNMPLAESYIEKSQQAGHLEVFNVVAWSCFENLNYKKRALKFSNRAIQLQKDHDNMHTHTAVALWNNDFDLATESMNQFLVDYVSDIDEQEGDFIQLFTLFLAKGQTNLVDNWLKEYQLCERLKPLYYALMSLMQDKYPNEILRMGAELKETVDEILLRIKDKAVKYA